jgi:hypothetical protein
MHALFFVFLVALPIWWAAQAVLSLRDYFTRRRALRSLPPPTGEEMELIKRARSEIPRKEPKTFRWYLSNPRESFIQGWIFVPALLAFWPMVTLSYCLPPLEVRLTEEQIRRVRSCT